VLALVVTLMTARLTCSVSRSLLASIDAVQAELRDCQVVLAPEELKKVSFGPKIVEFGHVSVHSVNKKWFSLMNNLPQSILVQLKVSSGITLWCT
jgi:hypothetical protein